MIKDMIIQNTKEVFGIVIKFLDWCNLIDFFKIENLDYPQKTLLNSYKIYLPVSF